MTKCIFFDRDGIINERLVGAYVRNWKEFKFIEEFFDLFELIDKYNFLKIIITNQQGIGKRLMSQNDLKVIHKNMQLELFNRFRSNFDDIYFSSDLANTGSFYRKPQPGMLLQAIEKWNINKDESYFIGDSLTDAQAGINAGVKTILVGEFDKNEADYVFKNHSELINNIERILS